MAVRRTIFDDPRYDDFVARYHADPLRFAVEVCGMLPSEDQEQLLYDVAAPTAKVSVVSGTSTGKTNVFARIALWHLLAFPVAFYEGKVEIGSNTYVGGPFVKTVADGVWKEMQDATIAIRQGPVAWIADYYTINKTRVTINGFEDQWFISQLALAKGQSVGVAGKHRWHQMIIVDEACGVPDTHFDVIDGTQTQGGNKTLLASQGARNAGRFYDSHHSLSVENGGSWTSLTFSSENSPFATQEWLRQRLVETGGRDSPEYQIRVLGRFAENNGKYMLGRAAIEKRIGAAPVIRPDEAWGHLIIVDVAAGALRDKTVATHVRVIGNGDRVDADPRRIEVVDIPVFSNAIDWSPAARQVVDYVQGLSNVTILVDAGGQGMQFVKRLQEFNAPNVKGVNWGNPCFKKRNKDRFTNLRAQCTKHAAEAVEDGRITFIAKHKKELLDQGSRIPFSYDGDRARYKIASKEEMAAEGIKSPDLWDTICMAFLESAEYMPSGDIPMLGEAKDHRAQARERALSELSDLS